MTLLLDCISHPRNLGSLLRIACAVDADVVLCGSLLTLSHPKVRSQILTWLRPEDPISFADLEARVRRVDHFPQAVERFRAEGRRIIGTSPDAKMEFYDVKYAGNDVLALGHEEGGLGETKMGLCDLVVRIPMPGRVNSLYVSVAAAIILYEALRQFRIKD